MYTFDLDSFFVAIGLIFTAYQLHLSRKSKFIQIDEEYRKRYSDLNEAREDFYCYYTNENFNLGKVKREHPEDYQKILSWEYRFFWFCFYQWVEGNVRKSVPKYLRKDWNYGIQDSMKNEVHKQVWEKEVHKIKFFGHTKFHKFIAKAIKKKGAYIGKQ